MNKNYFGIALSSFNRTRKEIIKSQKDIIDIKQRIMDKISSTKATPIDVDIIIAELFDSIVHLEENLRQTLIVNDNLRIENKLAYQTVYNNPESDRCADGINERLSGKINPYSEIPQNFKNKRSVLFLFNIFVSDDKKDRLSPEIIEIIIFCFNAYFKEHVSLYLDSKEERILGIIDENTTLFSVNDSLLKINKDISHFYNGIDFSLCYINNNPISILIESLIENHDKTANNKLENAFIHPYNFELDCLSLSNNDNSKKATFVVEENAEMPMT